MARSKRNPEEIALIHAGATVTDLAHIFGGSQNDIHKKIGGVVAPCSPRGETPIRYRIRDAAPYLVDTQRMSSEDVEAAIIKMTPAKLPPALQDAFWKGQTARLNYQERLEQLWSGVRVVEILGEAFKPISMTLRMMSDTVGQQTELTERQRELIDGISDSMLRSLQESLIDKFADYVPAPDEHGTPISEQQATVEMDDEELPEAFDDGFGD